jgi:hypothetical protein
VGDTEFGGEVVECRVDLKKGGVDQVVRCWWFVAVRVGDESGQRSEKAGPHLAGCHELRFDRRRMRGLASTLWTSSSDEAKRYIVGTEQRMPLESEGCYARPRGVFPQT